MLRFFLLLLCGCLMNSTLAQFNLALEKPSKYRRTIYKPGDLIRFQVEGSKAKYTGRIYSVNDSMLTIVRSVSMENAGDVSKRAYRDYVAISQIRTVFKRPTGSYGAFFRDLASSNFILGGAMFLVFLPLDAAAADQEVNPVNMSIGAGMLTTGLLIRVFTKRKHRMGKKWQVRAMGSY
ncbi:MAG: hypothetical protein AAGI38_00380 [Bacteroidota bacterium]